MLKNSFILSLDTSISDAARTKCPPEGGATRLTVCR
jgi:hypothetical protein